MNGAHNDTYVFVCLNTQKRLLSGRSSSCLLVSTQSGGETGEEESQTAEEDCHLGQESQTGEESQTGKECRLGGKVRSERNVRLGTKVGLERESLYVLVQSSHVNRFYYYLFFLILNVFVTVYCFAGMQIQSGLRAIERSQKSVL